MEKDLLFRRLLHISAPAFLVYYLIPETFHGISRDSLLLASLSMVLVFEVYRWRRGLVLFGMKGYETRNVSAFAWAAMGMTIALLFFPMHLVVVAFLGLALVDSFIGELDHIGHGRYNPGLPFLLFTVISIAYLWTFGGMEFYLAAVLSIIGGLTIIISERPNLKWINDDFLVVVVPLFAMYFVYFFV